MIVGQGPNEVGALFVFGRYVCGTNPGLVYTPIGIITHRSDSVLIQQVEIPTDLADRYTDPETGKPLTTLRMTTSPALQNTEGATTSSTDDPLATGRLTLEVSVVISYRLSRSDEAYRAFVERIGTIEDFLQIVDDEVVTALRKEIAQVTPSQVFEQWKTIEGKVEDALRARVGEQGFDDLRVVVKAFDLPQRVNEELAERTKAHIAVGTERLKGDQARERDTRVAEANRALAAARIQGIIDAFHVANPEMTLTEGQLVVLAHQAMLAEVLPTADHTAYGLGQGGLLDPNIANLLTGLNRPAGGDRVGSAS